MDRLDFTNPLNLMYSLMTDRDTYRNMSRNQGKYF